MKEFGGARNRKATTLLRQLGTSVESINLGRDYALNYGLLRRAIIQLERAGVDSCEARSVLASGMHALAKVSRQLGHSPRLAAGHYRRAFRMHASVGETRHAFSAILGQALALQATEPSAALVALDEANSFYFERWNPQERIRWLLRHAGAMRAHSAGSEAIRLHRRFILPFSQQSDFDPVERFIWNNSWAAVLIENRTGLEQAYDALSDRADAMLPNIDMLAVYDREVQAARLFILSKDVSLAEIHLQQARRVCVLNGYNPSALISTEKALDSAL